jgi:predicted RNase H-like HicB family nuclease
MKSKFTAVLRREEDQYVAFTPDLDIASQGANPEEALANLREAVSLFLECASAEEVAGRLTEDAWITQFEAEYATA